MTDAAAADASSQSLPVGLREGVRADAARRAGVQSDQVRIVRAEAVTWADASLGCPQPGMGYTQALVSGWRLVVDGGGTPMIYHANQAGTRWLLCDAGRAQVPAPVDPRN
jgi:hypothetical protein